MHCSRRLARRAPHDAGVAARATAVPVGTPPSRRSPTGRTRWSSGPSIVHVTASGVSRPAAALGPHCAFEVHVAHALLMQTWPALHCQLATHVVQPPRQSEQTMMRLAHALVARWLPPGAVRVRRAVAGPGRGDPGALLARRARRLRALRADAALAGEPGGAIAGRLAGRAARGGDSWGRDAHLGRRARDAGAGRGRRRGRVRARSGATVVACCGTVVEGSVPGVSPVASQSHVAAVALGLELPELRRAVGAVAEADDGAAERLRSARQRRAARRELRAARRGVGARAGPCIRAVVAGNAAAARGEGQKNERMPRRRTAPHRRSVRRGDAEARSGRAFEGRGRSRTPSL